MVTRILSTALAAAALSAGLLAQQATGAEAIATQQAPAAADFAVDATLFRAEIDDYVRALNEQLRSTLNEELRRELAPKVVLASNELRVRG